MANPSRDPFLGGCSIINLAPIAGHTDNSLTSTAGGRSYSKKVNFLSNMHQFAVQEHCQVRSYRGHPKKSKKTPI